MRFACVSGALCAATLLAGCGGSGPVDPVAARTTQWVHDANAFCLPRDVAIRKAESAAAPVFFTRAVKAMIRAEANALERRGVFRRIPLLAYKWRIAANALRDSAGFGIDDHLLAAHRVAEEYGIRCRLGAIPLSRLPGG